MNRIRVDRDKAQELLYSREWRFPHLPKFDHMTESITISLEASFHPTGTQPMTKRVYYRCTRIREVRSSSPKVALLVSMDDNTWITGNDTAFTHVRKIDSGAFGDVHEVYPPESL